MYTRKPINKGKSSQARATAGRQQIIKQGKNRLAQVTGIEASLKERLSVLRNRREQAQLEKRKQQERATAERQQRIKQGKNRLAQVTGIEAIKTAKRRSHEFNRNPYEYMRNASRKIAGLPNRIIIE